MDIPGNINFWYVICVLVIILFAVYAVRSYLKRLKGGCCGSGDSEKIERIKVFDRDPDHYPYKAVLTIDGMVCGSCVARVENALNSIEGLWAKVDLTQKQAVIRMKHEVRDNDLRSAVNSLRVYTVIKIERDGKA